MFTTLLVVVLFFVNRYIYKHRYEGYMFQEAVNYVQFYYTESDYRVAGLQKNEPNSLTLKIAPSEAKRLWQISTPVQTYTMQGRFPEIKLEQGICNYKINSDLPFYKDTIRLRAEFLNKEVILLYSSLPVINYKLFPVSKWTGLPRSVSNADKKEVDGILKNEIGITKELSSLEKVKRIGQFLLKKMRRNEGSPSDTIKNLTPLRQYKLVCENNDTLDCAIWTDIFFLFANCAGIPTRRIGVGGSMDNIAVSGHVFNECYIPEQQRWAFVDLTSRKLMVVDEKGRVFNSVALAQLNRWQQYCNMHTITINAGDSIVERDYASTNQSELEYLKSTVLLYAIRPDINQNMSFSETFREFLGTTDHYGVAYSNLITIDNSKHYLKLFIFKTSLGVFAFWLLLILIKLLRLAYRILVKNKSI